MVSPRIQNKSIRERLSRGQSVGSISTGRRGPMRDGYSGSKLRDLGQKIENVIMGPALSFRREESLESK